MVVNLEYGEAVSANPLVLGLSLVHWRGREQDPNPQNENAATLDVREEPAFLTAQGSKMCCGCHTPEAMWEDGWQEGLQQVYRKGSLRVLRVFLFNNHPMYELP